jgi:F-type H+-transporting ATPase subunit alpha
MAAFAQFGSDLDKATQTKLAQGERLMEVLKQAQFSPYTTAQQYVILNIAVNGHLMDVAVKKIPSFIKGFLEHLAENNQSILENLDKSGESTVGTDQVIVEALESYKNAGSEWRI